MMNKYDLEPLEFLVVGNGASIHAFDWHRVDSDLRVIVCNGAWLELEDKIAIDYVVACDDHWVQYNKEHCRRPCYTTDRWATRHSQHTVPGNSDLDITGTLAIKLALAHAPEYIHCIGFDTVTHDGTERWHEHELKRGTIKKTQRFRDQYHLLLADSKPTVLHCLSSPKQWETWCYK
jgi:hypothetical protein